MPYSLHHKAVSEFLGMAITIYTGESALANELLPSTKGHGMGWGWTVFTFGFAFFIPLLVLGRVSAAINPAMLLARVTLGQMDGVTFVVLSLADIAGAMMGALLHWLHFLPHYKTVPEPPALDRGDNMLRRRDTLGESALQIASYNTRVERQVPGKGFKNPLDGVLYYLKNDNVVECHTADELLEDYFHAAGGHLYAPDGTRKHSVLSLRGGPQSGARDDSALPTTAPPKPNSATRPLARRTIQVADLQQHLADLHVEGVLRQRTCPTCVDKQQRPSDQGEAPHDGAQHDALPHQHASTGALSTVTDHTERTGNGSHAPSESGAEESAAAAAAAAAGPPLRHVSDPGVAGGRHHESPSGVVFHAFGGHHAFGGNHAEAVAAPAPAAGSSAAASPFSNTTSTSAAPAGHNASGHKREGNMLKSILRQPGAKTKLAKLPVGFITEEQKRANALYQAALRADQNAKLSIFATRPAIYVPLYNFLTEAMGTAMLILGALMVELVAFYLPKGPARDVYTGGLQAFFITWVIVYLIAGLGGPTSYAANPARDLGPRIMHQLLPISNKGPSEWQYAWVPIFGPLVGGVAAAGIYKGVESLIFPDGLPL